MNSEIDRRELIWKSLAGLSGGVIGWIPNEIVEHGHKLGQVSTPGFEIAYTVAQLILAGFIGGMIIAADEQRLKITPSIKRKFIRGFFICAVLALISVFLSNYTFNSLLQVLGVTFSPQGQMLSGSILALIFARTLGWAIFGGILGAGVGLATLSLPNLIKGATGGIIGGAIGGIAFDLISSLGPGGLASRLFGLSAIGLAIGLFIGLVHELTKRAWLTVEAGRLRGRQYRIENAEVTIGRAEENQVGLFGDPQVRMRHARIVRSGNDFVLENLEPKATDVAVNGNLVERAQLRDGDQIKVGSYELAFHIREVPGRVPHAVPVGGGSSATVRPSVPAETESPCLVDERGRVIPLKSTGRTSLGRELDNDVILNDPSVSRRHAIIERRNSSLILKDLESHNGTFVDGVRINEQALRDGNTISLGDARLVFRTRTPR